MGRVRALLTTVALVATSTGLGAVAVTTAATPAAASPHSESSGPFLVDGGTLELDTVVVEPGTCEGPLDDVNVRIGWNSFGNADADVRLIGPRNVTIDLFTDIGANPAPGSQVVENDMLITDEAKNDLASVGSGAINGVFNPEGGAALSTFDGIDPTGTWFLSVTDDTDNNQNLLVRSWSLLYTCFDSTGDLPLHSTGTAPIPDLGQATRTVTMGACPAVTDVDVQAVFEHQATGDVRLELSHGATTIVVDDVQGRGVGASGLSLTYDDRATTTADASPTSSDGLNPWRHSSPGTSFKPDQPLATFNGQDGSGVWTLTAVDTRAADVGELQQFGLDVECGDAPPPDDPDDPDDPPPPGEGPCAQPPVIEDGFDDVEPEDVHESNIDCIAFYGIAQGISAGTYSPTSRVSRAQIATFVARLILVVGAELSADAPDAFPGDDAGPPHELSIDELAAAAVIGGNGEEGDEYFPTREMRRDEMASFLYNAYRFVVGEELAPGDDAFDDDDGNVHEFEINSLAARGIVLGDGQRNYGPDGTVTRGSMGSFLARTLQLLVTDGATATPL